VSEERRVGTVIKPHSLAGELSVELHTDSPATRFAKGAILTLQQRDGSRKKVTVVSARMHSGRLLTRFEEIPDRNAAELVRGATLLAMIDTQSEPEDSEEYYDHQLEGLTARTVAGVELGPVKEVLHGMAGDILVVKGKTGDILIPFVHSIVPRVDVAGGIVEIDPPEGLIED
jgi:16S rRNA processing protein RimM